MPGAFDDDTLRLTEGDVRLEPFLAEHVTPEYLGWINDPAVMRYTEARWTLHTRESAIEYVRASNETQRSRLFRVMLDDRHVGNLRLTDISHLHRHAQIAVILGDASARARGVGPRAISVATRHAFHTLGLHKLVAGMYADNQPSIRAFTKAGYQQAAALREHYWCEGRFVDGVMMERLAAEMDE